VSRHRVAIGSVFTECNQLGGMLIDMSWFERYELCRGDEILDVTTGVVGGMLGVLGERNAITVPLVYASTCPGGLVEAQTYADLKGEIVDRLKASLPVDGVLLPLHGAAAVEDIDDLEGDLIMAVREVVGANVPIVATLDLHANVTPEMVHHADALVAWETYPHRDSFSTGERGAKLLLDTLDGKCKPKMAMGKVPVITSAIHGSTEGDDPFADMMRFAKSHEGRKGVLSTSVFLLHPFLDQEGMGSGCVVVTDDDLEGAVSLSRSVAEMYWARRFDLEPEIVAPDEAIALGKSIDGGPVLLIEASDCCGGGAAGDSVWTIRSLVENASDIPTLAMVVDPEAAAACHQAGLGASVTVRLGHRMDTRWGDPLEVSGEVTRLSDGRFVYTGGIWDGVAGEMGASAVFKAGEVQILISSQPTYDWVDEQYRSMEMDAREAKFVVAKNPMNYRMAYGNYAKGVFVLDTPGPTPPTMRHVEFKKVKRPYFPLDEYIQNFEPVILV
jgi:microcystin degradation protein MlrC